ncbi:FUSC family protein [Streptomyces sp. NPDC002619]|uniref:FUSC family protein n=1 Tax=Streptomyces sp. NPDC002619 TaxID=3364655 RepID=UPI00367FDCA7
MPDLLPPRPGADQVAGASTASSAAWSRPRRGGPLKRCHVRWPSVLRPGSHLLLLSARVAVGCTLAGWASTALGVGRPYWAVVAAASIFQSNLALTWRRALDRVFGNFVGLALFAALLPITRTGSLALVLAVLFFQVATEATISRGYWLGQVCIVQMSLLMPQFAYAQSASELLTDRALDTLTGCALGLLVAIAIADRRAVDRAESAQAAVNASHAAAARLISKPSTPDLDDLVHARCRLTSALAELREAAEVTSGEWWQRALPHERIAAAEHESRQMLTLLAVSLSVDQRR